MECRTGRVGRSTKDSGSTDCNRGKANTTQLSPNAFTMALGKTANSAAKENAPGPMATDTVVSAKMECKMDRVPTIGAKGNTIKEIGKTVNSMNKARLPTKVERAGTEYGKMVKG